MEQLFSPLEIKSVRFRNRIAVSPMCQYSATDGFANNWHLVHLGARAVGGAGLVLVEATGVSAQGRITPGCLGLWKDEQIGPLKNIVEFIHQQGAVAGIQLAHAGRKASCALPWQGGRQLALEEGGWETMAPSPIPFNDADRPPLEMSRGDIQAFYTDYRNAVKRAREAGFKVLEIHAAHGYLLHEFMSPLSNKRLDEYGGSFDNRIRLLLELIGEIRQEWPDELPLFVRISATDWVEDGWTIEDSIQLATRLQTEGIDLIDCSTGGNIGGVKIPVGAGYQVPFAEAVRKTGMRSGAVGMIETAQQANAIIAEEKADLVLLAREFLRNPYFPLEAAKELGVELEWPEQYLRAKK
ncbi:NADH:flavin oxidoreductase/NADH oxidase [Flavihumibacter sp. CACIAM 22H1]|uniref:NADH:flavin oxidoreductase/NADH oxidase n=1 Tax=Flavihumibacter sp. CACIAM 22H1 TaxID=1812911 RepID=UPI0007A932C2|nr:NADH:flavin oxidoreductase/NADH oxidase [Flavihumibacter sp. CACIAM 22H1]KYP14987.1 MAG: oxidoreductase [Flavihumibacter sp. CACIAM 22H1]